MNFMDKLKMHTPDFTDENIAKLIELFPNCRTEAEDKDGNLKPAIDFDLLKQELSGNIVEGPQERYHLDWPGKREALLTANAPIAKTLRPCRDESVRFDTTKNHFIEGDNLDALKLLQETYLGKVKMIYIDPPYNTGKDFIYKDDFAADKDEYFLRSMQTDEEGNRLVQNTDSNGRFHSDWLSSIYSRVRLCRNLMADDCLIFISINDIEWASLRRICDEIFGEKNFLDCYVWESTFRPDNSSKLFRKNAEFVLCYAKNVTAIPELVGEVIERTGLPSLTKTSMNRTVLNFPAKSVSFQIPDETYRKADFGTYELMNDVEVVEGTNVNEFALKGPVIWGQSYLEEELAAGTKIIIKTKSFVPYSRKGDEGILRPASIIPREKVGDVLAANAEIRNLFGKDVFDYPKPVSLISYFLKMRPEADLILDFFAGSATTAHATYLENAIDNGSRKFILVQLDEAINAEQFAAIRFCQETGLKPTISQLAMERTRRAGAKIKEQYSLNTANLDIGFRVLKVDTSNMKDVYYSPDTADQRSLLDQVTNIKEDRTPEDLLFQVLLDWGVDLTLPIAKETIAGKTTFFVDTNALAACFDEGISTELVKEIAKQKPMRAVFRDTGYDRDDTKINVAEVFKLISPDTEVKAI